MSTLKVSTLNLNSSENTKIAIATNDLDMAFTVNASERVRIDTTGNLLIGRTNSTVGQNVELDINGAVNASAYLVNGITISDVAAFNRANTANITADRAFGQANLAYATANGAQTWSSAAFTQANLAYAVANTIPLVATVLEMETSTSNTIFVSPGRQQYHPSSAKFWVKADVAGATQATYNVTSVTDAAVGQIVINITNGFSSTNWVCMALAYGAPSRIVTANSTQAQATNTIKLSSASAGTTYADPVNYYVVGYGDLP